MEFVDSHAHLNAKEFTRNWTAIVSRAVEHGVTSIINNAGDLPSTEWGIEQAQKSPHLYATAGIHPEFFLESERPVADNDFNNLRRLIAQNDTVVAVGEIGLDYSIDTQRAPVVKQQQLLRKQLEIALEFALPVTLHVRDVPGSSACFNDMLAILKEFTTSNEQAQKAKGKSQKLTMQDKVSSSNAMNPSSDLLSDIQASASRLTGVFHCWTGTPDQLQQALELGFYISFSGIITYKSAGHILDAAMLAPLDRILIETDAPYLTPEPARSGDRPSVNEPKYVIMTAEKLATIKGVPLQDIAQATSRNARHLFKLPDETQKAKIKL